jgi:hypothetical protein
MNDYERGFLEGLQAVCYMAERSMDYHMKNADNKEISESDQTSAFDCACILGSLQSDIKSLAARVHRKQLDPHKIAEANGENFWWATEDGKGRN